MSTAVAPSTQRTGSTADKASKPKPVSWDAELAKYQSQLSDWVHCASAKTPEGKAKIEEITAKISAVKLKLEKAEKAANPAGPKTDTPVADAATRAHNTKASEPADSADPASRGPARRSSLSPLGHTVDVYA